MNERQVERQVYHLQPSNRVSKKLKVHLPNGSWVHFGARGWDDFTLHHDPIRRDRYIKRHERREDWTDLTKAGAWARWILWNKPNFRESVRDMERRFNIKIVVS